MTWKTIGHLFHATSSFVHHFVAIGEFKLELTVPKCLIWVKINDFFSRVTLQFDRWPWKTLRHLFHTTSSFVHHFVAIGEFKPELQSGNAQFESNSTIFRAVWPCNLTDDLAWKTIGHLFHATSSFVHHFIAIGEFKLELQSGKCPIWVKFDDF